MEEETIYVAVHEDPYDLDYSVNLWRVPSHIEKMEGVRLYEWKGGGVLRCEHIAGELVNRFENREDALEFAAKFSAENGYVYLAGKPMPEEVCNCEMCR